MLIASFGLMVLGGRNVQLDATVKYGFLNFLATTIFLLGAGTDLWADGYAEHGRHPCPRAAGEPGGDGIGGGAAALGLRHEGGGIPGECLAAGVATTRRRRRSRRCWPGC